MPGGACTAPAMSVSVALLRRAARRPPQPAAPALGLCLPAAEPERAAGAHRREGRLLPGRGHRLAPGPPAGLRRGGPPQLTHALHPAHLPVPHGEEREGGK